jgi:TPR repeat protein
VRISTFLILPLSLILAFTSVAENPKTDAAIAAEEKIEHMRKMAKKGHLQAQLQLAATYFYGRHGAQRDYTLAMHWFQKAEEKGSAVAQFNLGLCYDRGLGVERDVAKALDYYKKAADQDLEQGQINASALLIELGMSSQAEDYLRIAAAKNNAYAMREYARMLLYGRQAIRDPAGARELLDGANEAGDTESLLLLADYHSGNIDGVPPNGNQMFDYLWKAAARNIPEAMSKVGFCYEEGIGVKRDTATAVKWYRKASEAGHPQAMINLAHCCNMGKGTEHDPEKAVSWFYKAAQSKHPEAKVVGTFNLGVAFATGSGVEKNESKAFKLFEMAAKAGYAQAQYNAGVFCEEGRGREPDITAAAAWYRKAADRGEEQAMLALATFYLKGTGVERNRDEARKLLQQASGAGSDEALAMLKQYFPTAN